MCVCVDVCVWGVYLYCACMYVCVTHVYVCVLCVCSCMFIYDLPKAMILVLCHECPASSEARKSIRCTGAGVIGTCEPTSMSTESKLVSSARVANQVPLPTECLLSPLFLMFHYAGDRS